MGPVFGRERGTRRGYALQNFDEPPDLLRCAMRFAQVDILVLLDKGRELCGIGFLAQHGMN